MKRRRWILNARIVEPYEEKRGNVLIEDGVIRQITDRPIVPDRTKGEETVDAAGMYLLPGLIDIHCDAIEKEVQPRPNTLFPLDTSFYEIEKKCASAGITTMYHSLSLGVGLSLRGEELVLKLIELIERYPERREMIRNRIHLRYELIHTEGLSLVHRLIDQGVVDYLSFTNHGPGQGQYSRPGSFEAYVMKNQGVDREEARQIAQNAVRMQERIDWTQIKLLAETAAAKGIAIASHDDDSQEQIDKSIHYGATVSEFPLNLKTAAYARAQGMHICVGAPNVVRGRSHDDNMRAMDAFQAGAANILCSDYYPPSLLQAVFHLYREGVSLAEAVRTATLHPARAVRIDDRCGSIELDKAADLLLVELIDGYPFVHRTIVGGEDVYIADFYRRR